MVEKFYEGDNLVLINDKDNCVWVAYNKDNSLSTIIPYDSWFYTEEDLLDKLDYICETREDLFEFVKWCVDNQYNRKELEDYMKEFNLIEEYREYWNKKASEE